MNEKEIKDLIKRSLLDLDQVYYRLEDLLDKVGEQE
jgi:hypothetical protein